MAGLERSTDLSAVPDCIYTLPEIACVGMTEEAAKEAGLNVRVGKSIMQTNGKSLVAMQTRGFIKVVYDEDNDRLVGAQLMCARATDIINELSDAIVNKLSKKQLLAVIRPHPTFGEAINEAIADLDFMAIHGGKKKTK